MSAEIGRSDGEVEVLTGGIVDVGVKYGEYTRMPG